jgi:hypothetical protein
MAHNMNACMSMSEASEGKISASSSFSLFFFVTNDCRCKRKIEVGGKSLKSEELSRARHMMSHENFYFFSTCCLYIPIFTLVTSFTKYLMEETQRFRKMKEKQTFFREREKSLLMCLCVHLIYLSRETIYILNGRERVRGSDDETIFRLTSVENVSG